MAQPLRYLFDFDGTVTRRELLPLLGRELGLEEELTELTRRTIAGDIPFEVSFRHRVELLRHVAISRVQEIVAEVEIDPDIAEFIRARRDRCAIVTGNLDVWVAGRCRDLCETVYCSRAQVRGDALLGVAHVLDKREAVDRVAAPCVAVGDGHGDIPMFEGAALGIAFGGVHPPAAGLLDVATHACYDARTLCRFLSRL